MKWLFRIFLFIGVLCSAGAGHSATTSHIIRSAGRAGYDLSRGFSNHLYITPAAPHSDSRIFQLVEDEEDITASRVKKSLPAITLISAFFLGSIALFLIDIKVNPHYRSINYVSDPLPRYIQLRSIRI